MAKTERPSALGQRAAYDEGALAIRTVETLPLAQIRMDGGTQARAALRDETVEEYREAMEATGGWGDFPAVEVVFDGATHWLTDGFHRLAAARQALGERVEVPAKIIPGDFDKAVEEAARANNRHGLRRSNADKRRAVTMLLMRKKWQGQSDPKVAEAADVSARFVGEVRRELERSGQVPVVAERRGLDGRKINTRKIGREAARKPEPAPAPWTVEAREQERATAIAEHRAWQAEAEPLVHFAEPAPAPPPEQVVGGLPRVVAAKLYEAALKDSFKMFLTPGESQALVKWLKKALLEGVQ